MRFLSALLLSFVLGLTACSGGQAVESPSEPTPPIIVATPLPTYDPNTDYMSLMIRAVVDEDFERLAELAISRNHKIIGLGLDEPLLTVEEFLEFYQDYSGFNPKVDYFEAMIVCCADNNAISGRAVAAEWDARNAVTGEAQYHIDFDDFYLLSKIICNEAGSNWLSLEWKMMVGEVFLNRVASPEFPDTFAGVAYQPSQYSGANSQRFANMIPTEACAEAALRLLIGERIINDPSVIFQANFRQGSAVWKTLYDSKLGYTYLCHSNKMYLYD